MLNSLYKRGMAGGLPQIGKDTIFFRYKDETFEVPTYYAIGYGTIGAHYDGICYTVPVTKLRKLAKKLKL